MKTYGEVRYSFKHRPAYLGGNAKYPVDRRLSGPLNIKDQVTYYIIVYTLAVDASVEAFERRRMSRALVMSDAHKT
jgi:hypothetical protein